MLQEQEREREKEKERNDRRVNDPLISAVLTTLDWSLHIKHQCKKPFINCRDEYGNLYTIYPEFDEHRHAIPNTCYVYKE